jgi:hypothetical protein
VSSSSAIQSQGSCHFRDIGKDTIRMFIVAIISALVSAPLALSVQYLIMNVLSKESVNEEEEAKKMQEYQTRRVRSTRRLDGVSPSSLLPSELEENCGRNLLDDLNNLLRELSAHYAFLLARREDQAKEFRSKSCIPFPSLFRHLILFLRCLGISCGGEIFQRQIKADSSFIFVLSSVLSLLKVSRPTR